VTKKKRRTFKKKRRIRLEAQQSSFGAALDALGFHPLKSRIVIRKGLDHHRLKTVVTARDQRSEE
jgi:hypothetical protein